MKRRTNGHHNACHGTYGHIAKMGRATVDELGVLYHSTCGRCGVQVVARPQSHWRAVHHVIQEQPGPDTDGRQFVTETPRADVD